MSESERPTDPNESDEEYKRTTLYLRDGIKREYERWMMRLKLDHRLVEDAYKREMHESIIAVVLNNSDEFLEHLQNCVDDPEAFERTVEDLGRP